MRKTYFLLLLPLLLLLSAAVVSADTADVTITPLSRYNYVNLDGYGFYGKCADYSWFCMIWNNNSETESHTITLPTEGYVTGWSGTKHTISDYSYLKKNYGDSIYLTETLPDREPFDGTLTLEPKSTYAVFFNVNEFENYNLYWDTDLFFKVVVDETDTRSYTGKLAQRGNACPVDRVVTMEIVDGGYNSDGGDGALTVTVKNAMPDAAPITMKTYLDYAGVDASGNAVSGTLEDAVTWDVDSFRLASGASRSLTGTFTLPVEIAAPNRTLDVTAHLYFPSSLWFGNIAGSAALSVRGGVHGILSGSYAPEGGGEFTAKLTNHLANEIEVTLPETGSAKYGSAKQTVNLTWNDGETVVIGSEEQLELSGTYEFDDISPIASNTSMILSALFNYGGGSFTAAGTVTRDADMTASISSVGFCRDYPAGADRLTFTFSLSNDSYIDIPVQLPTTLAVQDVTYNPTVTYTACLSSDGSDCFSRISNGMFTLRAGEVAALSGYADSDTVPDSDDKYVRTSLLYFPDGVQQALYVGSATTACTPVSDPDDVPDADADGGEARLEFVARSGSYASCADDTAVTFGFTVTNSGTDTGELDLSALIYELNAVSIESDVSYTSCVLQSGSGSDPSCTDDLPSLTINPGVSVAIEAVYTPAEAVADEKITIAVSDGDAISFNVDAYSTGTCSADVIIEADAEDNPMTAVFNPDIPGRFTLTVKLTNKGTETAVITPRSLYLHGSAYKDYTDGIGQFTEAVTQKDVFAVQYEVPFDLPAHTTVSMSIPLTYDADSLSGTVETANWTFGVGSDTMNVTGTLNFPAASDDPIVDPAGDPTATPTAAPTVTETPVPVLTVTVLPTETPTVTEEPTKSETPTETETPAETETPIENETPSADENSISVYSLVEPQIAEVSFPDDGMLTAGGTIGNLPATGFSALRETVLSERPAAIAYRDLGGLRIQIPSLSVSAELRGVPYVNGEWAVEWLGADAGLLDNGVVPGKGTAVIAAHNHINDMSAGPFLFIDALERNDRIFVTDDDGLMLMYRVYANELVTPDAADAVYDHAIPGSLVLVTCENEMLEGGYAYRRLIFAEPLQ